MSKKMTSQKKFGEIKLVPYQTPLDLPKHKMFWYYSWGPTKTRHKNFFFNHEPKHQRKLASPIADEDRHKIAFWYNTYMR
jgi:hypothetical protein